METKKINFKELQGALSRSEMKKIMAGSLPCGVRCGYNIPPCGTMAGCHYCRDNNGNILPPNTGIGICAN